MKRSVLFGVFLALLVVVVAFAQGKPNFSGTWTPPAPAAGAGGGGGGGRGGGGPMTVTQTDKTLTVERTTQAGTMKTVYNLDGTESKNEMPGRGGGAPMVQTSTAKWDGAKLLITTKSEGPNGPMEQVQTWSMTADGNLQIERPGRGGGAPTATVYTKGK
jgi:hypothetical protein